ncbi:MAG: HAMP domain-containing histidine kinase [Ruminococcus sp.]|nr:HAMP domain-containing histidine kinase [Ruminococcus sp.]
MKQTKKKLSLKAYLSLVFLSFCTVLIIIMWLFQTVFFDDFYRAIKTFQVQRCASSISNNIEDDDITQQLKEIEDKNDMDISVYTVTEYGTSAILNPVYAPHNFTSSFSFVNMSSVYEYYFRALQNNGEVTVKSDEVSSHNLFGRNPAGQYRENFPPIERESVQLLTSAVITQAGDTQYFIMVEANIMPVTSTVDTLQAQLLIMTLFMVIVSIFVAIVTAHYISKPIRDTNIKAKQLAAQNYDITFSDGNYKELCELNDTLTYSAHELGKVDELRRELIANISHDLRTPLTMITGYSEVMRDIPGENSPENIQIIIDESNRLSQLVSDLLDISKLESGAVAVQNDIFNLTDCIKAIFSRYTKLIEQEGYNLVFDYEDDVFVNADPLRISQVMYNLINNAINYCGEDKTVIVKQTVTHNSVCVEVIDHGEGIEEDKLSYIWDRYYKVDKEHKRAVVGTGLGLSIVKNILNLYNADFGVKSSLGEGSVFWFVLPAVEKE